MHRIPVEYVKDPLSWLSSCGGTTSGRRWDELEISSKGDMSFIGPRPALLTQTAVLQGREAGGVQRLLPGVTGLAQVLGRDSLSDQEKVELDMRYLHKMNFWFDCYILWLTVRAVITGKGAV